MRHPPRVELDRARANSARGQHKPVGRVPSIVSGSPGADRYEPVAVALARDHLGTQHVAPASRAQRGSQDLVKSHSRDRRRQRRNLEHAPSQPPLEIRKDDGRITHAQDRGQPNVLLGSQHRRQIGTELGPPARIIEPAGNPERAELGPLEPQFQGRRAGVDPSGEKVGRAQAGVKVAQRRDADHADALQAVGVPGDEGARRQRRWLQRPQCRRQPQVVLDPADIPVTLVRSGRDGAHEPAQRLGHEFAPEERVRVVDPLRGQPGDPLDG